MSTDHLSQAQRQYAAQPQIEPATVTIAKLPKQAWANELAAQVRNLLDTSPEVSIRVEQKPLAILLSGTQKVLRSSSTYIVQVSRLTSGPDMARLLGLAEALSKLMSRVQDPEAPAAPVQATKPEAPAVTKPARKPKASTVPKPEAPEAPTTPVLESVPGPLAEAFAALRAFWDKRPTAGVEAAFQPDQFTLTGLKRDLQRAIAYLAGELPDTIEMVMLEDGPINEPKGPKGHIFATFGLDFVDPGDEDGETEPGEGPDDTPAEVEAQLRGGPETKAKANLAAAEARAAAAPKPVATKPATKPVEEGPRFQVRRDGVARHYGVFDTKTQVFVRGKHTVQQAKAEEYAEDMNRARFVEPTPRPDDQPEGLRFRVLRDGQRQEWGCFDSQTQVFHPEGYSKNREECLLLCGVLNEELPAKPASSEPAPKTTAAATVRAAIAKPKAEAPKAPAKKPTATQPPPRPAAGSSILKKDVKIGGRYRASISGKIVTITILAVAPQGGWNATNEETGRKVHIKSAQKLRREALAGE